MRNQGVPSHLFDGRPVIGICNTWSELTPCNAHFRFIADRVKRGVYEAGGFPLEFPVMSLGESMMRPTTMLFRNLAAMEVEETIRANPIDGVVLLVGCDKTTPALLMGAASCDVPAIALSGGPMLNGKYRGKDIGSGTSMWEFAEQVRSGQMSLEALMEAEGCMSRSWGHCMTMGTASTMATMVETLGLGFPQNAAIPAADSRRALLAHLVGRRIVELVRDDVRISKILTREAFENAIVANAAIGGSTNALVHLIALAGRVGVKLTLDDWDRIGRKVPCLLNLMPSGQYLMEDFYYAGGVPALLKELESELHKDALTVNGHTLWQNCAAAENFNLDVIRSKTRPIRESAGLAVLKGNLAERGAVTKPSAATPALMEHRGRAVVFENIDELHARVDDPALDVTPGDIMVLKYCGPKGYPGFPEVGNLPIPKKLLAQGIKDIVRISDARMSGTAYGTVILHVSPEAAVGGALALVRTGDVIELSLQQRRLHLDVPEAELARRRAAWYPSTPQPAGGYVHLYTQHDLQADEGADFDFLRGMRGADVPKSAH
jgi:L-arabonate dehydrase